MRFRVWHGGNKGPPSGHPAVAHWPFPDTAKYQGSEEAVRAHFREVFAMIKKRLDTFLAAEGKC